MSNAQKRLLKEFKKYSNSNNKLSESIISLKPINDNNLFDWIAIINPIETIYRKGFYKLSIKLSDTYPITPPIIKFLTNDNQRDCDENITYQIPHCNIDFKTGEICLDILKIDNWSPIWTLEYSILAIIYLLNNQEPNSPLNIDFANLIKLNDKLAINSIINYYIK